MKPSKQVQFDQCREALEKAGYTVIVKSSNQLEVHAPGLVIDYWPTTGTWKERGSLFTGWGLADLMEKLRGCAVPVEDKDDIIQRQRDDIEKLKAEITRLKGEILKLVI